MKLTEYSESCSNWAGEMSSNERQCRAKTTPENQFAQDASICSLLLATHHPVILLQCCQLSIVVQFWIIP